MFRRGPVGQRYGDVDKVSIRQADLRCFEGGERVVFKRVATVSIRQADLRCFEGAEQALGLVEALVSIRQADLRCFEVYRFLSPVD